MNARRLLPLSSILLLSACHSSMGSTMGVTQGGSQDIGQAREIIAFGGIPSQDHFSPEGLFSEHDLSLQGEDCEAELCPRSATARIHPVDGSGEQLLVQLGFGTRFESETFERRPLNLSVAVDISGSMSGHKLSTLKDSMLNMIGQLGEQDTVSLVAFDDRSEVLLRPMTMDDEGRQALRRAVSGLETDGGTNMESGLADAFQQVAASAGEAGVEDRVMIFTDAQPNIRATGVDSFVGMARQYSNQGIGISVFGVGLDLGAELASAISELPGGNSFYLAHEEDIQRVLVDEFDYVVSPVAYNLEVELELSESVSLHQTWATPGDSSEGLLSFGSATLFLSARGGGMGVSLLPLSEGTEEGELAWMGLEYETLSGEIESDTVAAGFEGGALWSNEWVQADDLGVFKMAHLVDEHMALEAAAFFCEAKLSMEVASARIEEAEIRLHSAFLITGDASLEAEAELMAALRENVSTGVTACQ